MKRLALKLPPDTVGVADAKRDLIALIDRVLRTGKPVTIARRGRPVVQISALSKPQFWVWRPEFAIPDDDPFWEGELRTREWRRDTRFRGRGPESRR